jgi:hypothetical protein
VVSPVCHQVRAFVRRLDLNNDGIVGFEEFRQVTDTHRPAGTFISNHTKALRKLIGIGISLGSISLPWCLSLIPNRARIWWGPVGSGLMLGLMSGVAAGAGHQHSGRF